MFTLNKLSSMPFKTALRKIVRILQKVEIDIRNGIEEDLDYIFYILSFLNNRSELIEMSDKLRNKSTFDSNSEDFLRYISNIRHNLLKYLEAEPSDWDLISYENGNLDETSRKVYPLNIYLEDLRAPFNVGSIFRSSESFGVNHIYQSAHTPLPTHNKAVKTSRGCEKSVNWSVEPLSVLDKFENVFALELDGTPVSEFNFPDSGIVLIGSEELGLSPESIKIAKSKLGIVSIPQIGAKKSINVSVAFGILIYTWFMKVQN